MRAAACGVVETRKRKRERTAGRPPLRFPAAPARQLVLAVARERRLGTAELARYLGVDRRTLQRLFSREEISWLLADRLAVACGLHPCAVWPEWFPAAVDTPGRTARVLPSLVGRDRWREGVAGVDPGPRRRLGLPDLPRPAAGERIAVPGLRRAR